MDIEGEKSRKLLFDPFSEAETACEEAIDLILTEGGRLLYESYVERKSYPYASAVTVKLLVSELKMCFVRCDEGEPRRTSERPTPEVSPSPFQIEVGKEHVHEEQLLEEQASKVITHDRCVRDGWTLEPEPIKCRVDTWARSCVPIRKKLVRPRSQGLDDGRRRPRSNPIKVPSISRGNTGENRLSPSRNGTRLDSTLEQQAGLASTRDKIISLVDEREEDEEEAALRDLKDREARRKREEEVRIHKKIVEEAEEAAQLANMKDQMNNKPFTYDNTGNVMWVQPVQLHKLPSPNPTPGYTFKKEVGVRSEDAQPRPAHQINSKRSNGRFVGRRRESQTWRQQPNGEFVDSFKSFASQQPSMIETMNVVPGVELSERGRVKKGPDESAHQSQGQSTMSRKDYEHMIQKGARKNANNEENLRAASHASSAQGAQEKEQPSIEPSISGQTFVDAPKASKGELRDTGGTNLRVVQAANAGTDLIRHAPPIQLPQAPPPTFRRVQMKRDALGYVLSTREKSSMSAGSRYPGCAAQPPLGATMGHGLLPNGQKHDEYYFPNANSTSFVESLDDAAQVPVPPHSARGGSRGPQGQIVNKNPELTRRLFSR